MYSDSEPPELILEKLFNLEHDDEDEESEELERKMGMNYDKSVDEKSGNEKQFQNTENDQPVDTCITQIIHEDKENPSLQIQNSGLANINFQ